MSSNRRGFEMYNWEYRRKMSRGQQSGKVVAHTLNPRSTQEAEAGGSRSLRPDWSRVNSRTARATKKNTAEMKVRLTPRQENFFDTGWKKPLEFYVFPAGRDIGGKHLSAYRQRHWRWRQLSSFWLANSKTDSFLQSGCPSLYLPGYSQTAELCNMKLIWKHS